MAENKITETQLKSLCSKFSIKNFIADLPRMLNEAFTTIYKAIMDFYNPDEQSINAIKLHATYIDATTVVAQNLKFKGSNGEIYNYNDIGRILSEIEHKMGEIKNITKEQIDSLDIYPLQPWPLLAEYYSEIPSGETAEIGDKILTSYGLKTYMEDEDTHITSWVDTQVPDGIMYICEENMNLYKRDETNLRWINLGKYKNL